MSNKLCIMRLVVTLLILTIVLFACKKEDEILPPVLSLKSGDKYTTDGSVIEVGHKLKFGVTAREGSSKLTNFTIKKHLPDGSVITVMDTGMNTGSVNIEKIFYQNVEDTAEWVFTVMDKKRLTDQASLLIYKDTASEFAGIYHFTSIKMGYQENTEYGHFCDANTGEVYFKDTATALNNRIDILVYYIVSDNLPSPVFSSPGEMDNYGTDAQLYYPCIANWSQRNYTLWDISVDNDPISEDDFNKAHNDSLLIVSYNNVWGKKKFKWATDGRVIPFKTSEGKFGLVKVNSADHSDFGTIDFDIKIQQ